MNFVIVVMSRSPSSRRSSSVSRIVDDLKSYIDKTFGPQRSRKRPVVLKKGSNQKQYDTALETYNEVEDAEHALKKGDKDAAMKSVKRARKMLERRMKMIRFADRNPHGWLAVEQYLSDDLASDSEDDKRLKKAESEAAKKVQMREDERRKKRAREEYPRDLASGSRAYGGRQFFRAPEKKRFRYDDVCYACGKGGHWRVHCPSIKSEGKASAPQKPQD